MKKFLKQARNLGILKKSNVDEKTLIFLKIESEWRWQIYGRLGNNWCFFKMFFLHLNLGFSKKLENFKGSKEQKNWKTDEFFSTNNASIFL